MKLSRKQQACGDIRKLRKPGSCALTSSANSPFSKKAGNKSRTRSKFINSPSDLLRPRRLPTIIQGGRRSRSVDSANPPGFVEQFLQHSRLDRSLYITYEPSITSQDTFESSLRSEASHCSHQGSIYQSPGYQPNESDYIVHDSQSLPDSSSYLPTLSLDYSTRSAEFGASLSSQATGILNESQFSNWIIPSSQGPSPIYRRSRSVPASTIPDSTSAPSFLYAPPSLARSTSDPGRTSQLLSQSQLSDGIEIPDSAEKDSGKPDQIKERIKQRFNQVPYSALTEDISTLDCPSRKEGRQLSSDAKIPITSEYSPQNRPSQAVTTDESFVSERDQGLELQRQSVPSTEISQLLSRYSSQEQVSQTPPESVHIEDSEQGSQSFVLPVSMADVPVASQEIIEDSSAASEVATISAREKLKRQKVQAEVQLARQRAERQQRSAAKQKAQLSPRPLSSHTIRANSPPSVRSPLLGNRQTQAVYRASPNRTQMPIDSVNITPQLPRKSAAPSPGPSSPLARQHPLAREDSPTSLHSQASQSPSVLPDKPPYQVEEEPSRLEATPLEINTIQTIPSSTRNAQPSPYMPITPSKLSFEREISLSLSHNTLDICNLGRQEYAIHLSMPGRIQDHYCATIRHHARTIRSFLESNTLQRGTVDQINSLLDELSKVTIHIDLQGSGPSSQETVDPKCEADYANSCSGKFTFLGHLIEKSRDDELRICIVAKSGLLMDILETYLIAKEVDFTRWNGKSDSHENHNHQRVVKGKVKFLVLPSDLKVDTNTLQRTDLIIAFDESFDRQKFTVMDRKGLPPPVLHPVVYASLEHIDLCVPRTLNPIERLRKLVLSLLQTQKRVGAYESGDPEPATCAQFVAAFLNRSTALNSERSWPLPPMRPIENIRFMDSESNLSDALSDISDNFKPDGQRRYWPNPVPPKLSSQREQNGKRPVVSVNGGTSERYELIAVR